MLFLIYFLIFIFGLIIGSFLNCLIWRLQTGETFFKSRSYCPHCQQKLAFLDLIPLLSFLILKGKCRYCSQKISWQYPLVEIFTGILFVLILNNFLFPINFQNSLTTIYLLLITSFLIIIFVWDLKHYIIPDKIVYPAIIITFFYNFLNTKYFIFNAFLTALFTAVFFLLIVLISGGRWMGMGDVKLAFLIGLFLAFPNILVALFLAFFSGAIIGLGLVISGKKKLSSEVPLGPFLVAGTFIAIFFGNQITNWYLNFIS